MNDAETMVQLPLCLLVLTHIGFLIAGFIGGIVASWEPEKKPDPSDWESGE